MLSDTIKTLIRNAWDDGYPCLVATNGPQVIRHETLQPIDIRKIPDFVSPRWIFDMGQNMVGWVRLRRPAAVGGLLLVAAMCAFCKMVLTQLL